MVWGVWPHMRLNTDAGKSLKRCIISAYQLIWQAPRTINLKPSLIGFYRHTYPGDRAVEACCCHGLIIGKWLLFSRVQAEMMV